MHFFLKIFICKLYVLPGVDDLGELEDFPGELQVGDVFFLLLLTGAGLALISAVCASLAWTKQNNNFKVLISKPQAK